MIHEIGVELQARLRAQGCPFTVSDRETVKRTAWTSNRIVIDETGDVYGSPTSQSLNPRRHFDCTTGARLTIYGQSTRPGAAEFEHRRVARRVADMALVALREIRASRRIGLNIGPGGFVDIADLVASEVKGGAVYELAFAVTRGVEGRTWAGSAWAEAGGDGGNGIDAVISHTLVGAADDDNPITLAPDPVAACGA